MRDTGISFGRRVDMPWLRCTQKGLCRCIRLPAYHEDMRWVSYVFSQHLVTNATDAVDRVFFRRLSYLSATCFRLRRRSTRQ